MGLLSRFKNMLNATETLTATFQMENDLAISKNNLFVHQDLIDLIWIGDGKYKNYTNQPRSSDTFKFDTFSIKVSSFGPDEPSLLYLNMPIKKPSHLDMVERPPYYPSYDELNMEQKWLYWNFLSDPYNSRNDIGYVFIFYYGLERHLLYGNYEKAFDVILKLRDVYKNASFQVYSSSALILSAMLHKRPEFAINFVKSLDKEHEFQIQSELYFLCKLGLNIPLTTFDIMHFYKAFGFTNNRYIKSNPEIFQKNLQKNLHELTGGNEVIYITQFFSKTTVSHLKTLSIPIFANVSIRDKEIQIPNLTLASKFTGTLFMLLNKTHEDTKKELALIRKQNKANQ